MVTLDRCRVEQIEEMWVEVSHRGHAGRPEVVPILSHDWLLSSPEGIQVKQAFSNEYLLVPHRSVEAEITA